MHEDGTLDTIVDVRHDLEFDAGLDLRGGRFVVSTGAGRRYDSALVDRLSTFNCDGVVGSGILEFAHSRSNSSCYRPTT